MRVAMIDPSLFTLPYDGALATALIQEGHEVTLFGRGVGPDDSNPSGIPLAEAFYRFTGSRAVSVLPGKLRRGIKGLEHGWSMAALARRLRRERPDVIHFQWLPLPLVDRPMLAWFRRIAPLVLTVHDTNPFNGDPASPLQRGFFACLAKFDRLVVHTEQGSARIVARGIPPTRLAVLPHGPVNGPAGAVADEPAEGDVTFVLFGKIKPYKGADTIIQAFARLPERLRMQARLRIVGKPYMELSPLHELIHRYDLAGRVDIEPRFVADAEVSSLFAPGAVALFPYREIDSSGVLPQALAHARPVIASRIGVFAEMLKDGVHGHLVPADDVAGFAAALAPFIEDRGFAAACSRNTLALSRSCIGWTEIARRTAAVYAEVIDRRRS